MRDAFGRHDDDLAPDNGEASLEDAFAQLFTQEGMEMPRGFIGSLTRALVRAVEVATERATQNVAAINRRRLVRHTAIITAVLVAAILTPVSYVLENGSRADNCRLITAIAKTSRDRVVENKAATEKFKRESADRLGLSAEAFADLIRKGEERESRQLAVYEHVAHASC